MTWENVCKQGSSQFGECQAAVFIDYTSFYQFPRSKPEDAPRGVEGQIRFQGYLGYLPGNEGREKEMETTLPTP